MVIEITKYPQNKGIGNLKHVKYIIPMPTFLSSNIFCFFHPLYSSILHFHWLCWLLSSLISLTLSLCTEVHYFETYIFLILSFIFFFLMSLFYYILTVFHENLYLLQNSKYTWPWYTISQHQYIESRRYECPVQECRLGLLKVTVLGISFVNQQTQALITMNFLPME